MMDARSETNLAHVHPDLAKVIRMAAQTPQPFEVILGLTYISLSDIFLKVQPLLRTSQ